MEAVLSTGIEAVRKIIREGIKRTQTGPGAYPRSWKPRPF